VPPPDSKKKLIDGDWNALVSQLPLAGMERMLAHNCELVAWQDGAIELRVPHAQRHLAERAYQNRLKLALEQHLGTKIRLEISVGAGNGNTLAAVQERENQQRQSAAAAAIGGDPFVRELIEHLGARVLSSTIKPVS
jgi:DNA polymerase-3 subunit gamma/tau